MEMEKVGSAGVSVKAGQSKGVAVKMESLVVAWGANKQGGCLRVFKMFFYKDS